MNCKIELSKDDRDLALLIDAATAILAAHYRADDLWAVLKEAVRQALEAALQYDKMIQSYGATGDVSFRQDGSAYASSDNLDDLYFDWLTKSRKALALLLEAEGERSDG